MSLFLINFAYYIHNKKIYRTIKCQERKNRSQYSKTLQ